MSKEQLKTPKQNLAAFSILVLLVIIAFWLNRSISQKNESISIAEQKREMSLLLVDELRQSSDDLTNMARLYVVSGDSTYKRYFNDIIKIRNGELERPIDYHEIYWDFVLASGSLPRPGIEKRPFSDLIREYAVSPETIEFAIRAKASSDDLILIEEEAFNAMKGFFKDSLGNYTIESKPDRLKAIDLLHSKDYLTAKAKIMSSIQDFYHFSNQTTYEEIQSLEADLSMLNLLQRGVILIAFIALVIGVITNYRDIKNRFSRKDKETESSSNTIRSVFRELKHSWVVILVSFIFSALVIIFLIYSNWAVKKNIELNLKQSLTTVSQSTNKTLTDWLTDLENSVDVMVQSNFVKALLIETLSQPEASNQNKLESIIRSNGFQSSYLGYALLDDNGHILCSSDMDLVGMSFIQLEDNKSAEELMQLQNIKLIFPSIDGESSFYNNSIKVIAPIQKDEKVLGQLILLFDPKERFTEVLQQGRLGNSGESYAFNSEGMMISESRFTEQLIELGFIKNGESSELNIELKDPVLKSKSGESTYTFMASNALKGYSGNNFKGYNDYRGVKVIGTWTWFDKYGFGTATEIDYQEAFKTYFMVRTFGVYGGALFIVLIIVLTMVFVLNRIKLSAINKQIQGIFDSLLDSLVIINDKGTILSCSPSTRTMFQYSNEELIGKNVNILMPSPYHENHDEYMENHLISGSRNVLGKEREFMAKRKDGHLFPIRLMVNQVDSAKGKMYVGLLSDLTERKKIEQRLKSQSTVLKSAANSIVITDNSGIINWVNPAFMELYGYNWNEVVGKNPKIWKSGMHDKSFYTNMWNTIMEGGVWQGEVINRKKNGELFYEEMTITPIKNEDDEIVQFVAIKNDISERKLQDEMIKASENRFRSITTSATDAIISSNSEGIIELWNKSAEKIFGYTESEVLGQPLDIIVPEKYRDAHVSGMQRVVSGGERRVIGKVVEVVGQHKDGRCFPIDLSVSSWNDNKEIKFSAVIRDVTDRKLYEKTIEDANKRMTGELNIAKEIQMSMLPLIFPPFPQREEIDIYAKLTPAREVGGDFYDFHFLNENHFYFVVGDVSGKGVPAALMMAVTKTLLKSQASNDRSTASILTHVNNEIAKDNDAYMFITVFIGILNTTTGELVYSNAGHNPSIIVKKDHEIELLRDLHGPVVGAMEDMTYTESRVNILRNEIIFAYTDGITEAQNMKEELFSDARLHNILKSEDYDNPKSLIRLVEKSVLNFQGKAEQFDDITMLAIQYQEDAGSRSINSISVSIKNQLDQMPLVLNQFEEFGERNNLPFGVIQKFNIALDELLNNIISYGFDDDLEHEIDIEIELRHERLIIILKDDGVPFNPFRNDPPDTKLSIEERSVGGLGIHLVKNLVDEYNYKRNTDTNVITLIKYNIKQE